MDWWGVVQGGGSALLGALAWGVPDWRAKRRRRRLARSMPPARAITFALVLLGLRGDEVAKVLSSYDEKFREEIERNVNRWIEATGR